MRRGLWIAAVLAQMVLMATPAAAQRRGRRPGLVPVGPVPELGARVGYDFDGDDWSLGGQLRVPGRWLETLASGDYYLAGGDNPWQVNFDLVLRLGRLRTLYAGGGIGIFHRAATDVGPNIVVGLHPPPRRASAARGYLEGRWTFLDAGTPLRLVFGVNLVLGR